MLSGRLALTLVWLLIVLSGSWTASTYADALGRGRADDLAEHLKQQPRVTVFAHHRLQLSAPGVVERALVGSDSSYHYSYAGLRLLTRGGGKYFPLPEGWRQESGNAIVLPDSAELRYEFGAGE